MSAAARQIPKGNRNKKELRMQKIPTLFKREFDAEHRKRITREVTEGCECVLEGRAVPTLKWDGAACAIIGGEIYKRYDAKQKYGKKPPEGAIPCQESPDPITGHWPHWVEVDLNAPADKWFAEALRNTFENMDNLPDGYRTYEAVGKHFNGNPYGLERDILIPHGGDVVDVERSFEGIKRFLDENDDVEGLVFWRNGKPKCKIKRSDFGLPWNRG